MPWTPAYNADYTKLTIRQLLAFVQRDQRAALDYIAGVNVLPSIQGYYEAPVGIPQSPGVMIVPYRALFEREAVGSRQSETTYFGFVEVYGSDSQQVAEQLQDYMRAVDLILSTVPLSDFYQSQSLTTNSLGTIATTPLPTGTVKDLFVASHLYDQLRKVDNANTVYWAVLEILVDREES